MCFSPRDGKFYFCIKSLMINRKNFAAVFHRYGWLLKKNWIYFHINMQKHKDNNSFYLTLLFQVLGSYTWPISDLGRRRWLTAGFAPLLHCSYLETSYKKVCSRERKKVRHSIRLYELGLLSKWKIFPIK